MAKIKITQKQKKQIAGASGLIVGLYMIFILNNNRGIIPLLIGGGLLWSSRN